MASEFQWHRLRRTEDRFLTRRSAVTAGATLVRARLLDQIRPAAINTITKATAANAASLIFLFSNMCRSEDVALLAKLCPFSKMARILVRNGKGSKDACVLELGADSTDARGIGSIFALFTESLRTQCARSSCSPHQWWWRSAIIPAPIGGSVALASCCSRTAMEGVVSSTFAFLMVSLSTSDTCRSCIPNS